jgi:geranylgeranylglycerol-phosphate geranylgeranyltransferase
MRSSTTVKIRACMDLIRMNLALGAGLFLVAGEILSTGGLPPVHLVLLGFLTLFFISGSSNISNDYFDQEVDRINLPTRPLPSGRISIRELWTLFTLFTIFGLITAAMLGPAVLLMVFALWGIAFLYNIKLKEFGFLGNLVVAFCLGMIFILAGILADTINGVVLTFAALAFFFDLGEEVASDALDMKGDEARSSKSLATRWGKNRAMRFSGYLFGIFILLTVVPFLMGWFGYDYLFLTGVMDLWMIGCVISLLRADRVEESRVQVQRLYFSWGLFVFVFALSRVIW